MKKMLIASGGDFSRFEITVKKQFQQTHDEDTWGRWATEKYLREQEHWDDDMIAHSKAWATERGFIRTNKVHGKEEWRVPLTESFNFNKKITEGVEATSSTHGEVGM